MRRLTAGEIRDSILAVNGSLNKDKMYGPSIFPRLPQEVLNGQSRPGENWGDSSAEDLPRRSIYIHIKRSLPVPLMAAFDVADTDSSCPVRFNTVQPTQALTMLNSQFVNEQADTFANSAAENESGSLDKQVQWVLCQVMQRPPTQAEIEQGTQFIHQLREDGSGEHQSLALFCVVALNLDEFLYLD
jgi:hypothetical protein